MVGGSLVQAPATAVPALSRLTRQPGRQVTLPAPLGGLAWFAAQAVAAALLTVLAVTLALRSSPYLVVLPGSVHELGPQIHLPVDQQHDTGWFAFTAARVGKVSYLGWLRAQLNPAVEVVPAAALHDPGVSDSEFSAVAAAWMQQSKTVATVVALRRADYPVAIGARGLLVEGVQSGSPVDGEVQPGDVIVSLNGRPAGPVSNFAEQVEIRAGAYLSMELLRGGQRMSVAMAPTHITTKPGWLPPGLLVSEYLFDVTLPFPVEVDSGEVTGDSAGLMFSLGLLDALTPGDLAGGHRVAGTGTIALDGQVGPIGGVAEKLMAAEQHGADIFLAPAGDYADAARAARAAQVIPVGTFEDALAALVALGGQLGG
jgi:Lon-like protease